MPALWAGQAPVGAEALALQVEGVGVGVGKGATGQQAVAVALKLAHPADQPDLLGMAATALQGEDRRAFEFVGARNAESLGQIIGLCLTRYLSIELIPGRGRSVFDGQV
ncbi:hypothetical protein D3C84_795150 [compost metagenome]